MHVRKYIVNHVRANQYNNRDKFTLFKIPKAGCRRCVMHGSKLFAADFLWLWIFISRREGEQWEQLTLFANRRNTVQSRLYPEFKT